MFPTSGTVYVHWGVQREFLYLVPMWRLIYLVYLLRAGRLAWLKWKLQRCKVRLESYKCLAMIAVVVEDTSLCRRNYKCGYFNETWKKKKKNRHSILNIYHVLCTFIRNGYFTQKTTSPKIPKSHPNMAQWLFLLPFIFHSHFTNVLIWQW